MNPNVDQLLYKINTLLIDYICRIIHLPSFQNLESNWRSLYDCLDDNYLVAIYSISLTRLNSNLLQFSNNLKDHYFDMPGAIPFALILLTFDNLYEKLLPLTDNCYATLISAKQYSITPLARPPYKHEISSSISDYLWSHPIFHFLKPNDLTLKYQRIVDTNALEIRILISRFIHCIKIQLRDAIGRFATIDQFQRMLQNWINQYTSQTQNRSNYPLETAEIKISNGNEKNSYLCLITLKPHNSITQTSTLIFYRN